LGMTEVYGLTTSGQEYMQSHGFTPVDKSKAPPSLLDSAQFKSECPAAAVLLHLTLA
jgi:N-acetylglutamate synthase-like GNAT family acetyltransferase